MKIKIQFIKDTFTLIILLLVLFCFYISKTNKTSKIWLQEEVAKVIAMEGCSEGKLQMWLIGNTIQNRKKINLKTAFEVVSKPDQYYGYTHLNKELRYKECKKDSLIIANLIYHNKLEDLTNDAIYYLRPDEKEKSWHQYKTIKYLSHTYYK